MEKAAGVRKALQPYLGQRLAFIGRIEKRHESLPRIMVKPVLLHGEEVSDHNWLQLRTVSEEALLYPLGTWIAFQATVRQYERLWPPNEGTTDYGLYKPRAIRIVERFTHS